MIYTSKAGDGLRFGPIQGEPVEMPWLTYWQGLERHGNPKERFLAKRIANMSLWRRFNWEPKAAEAMLGYIQHGNWPRTKLIRV